MKDLELARDHYRRRAWSQAAESLSRADRKKPLSGDDLDRLAICEGLLGRDEDFLATLERAHHAHLDAGDTLRAVRSAFWLGFRLGYLGERARAGGWFGRAHRLLEGRDDCVEHGYLLGPVASQQMAEGDFAGAYETASRAERYGERHGDRPHRVRADDAGPGAAPAGPRP
jgi:tetratricopeptide (TPR) repeat protein